MSRMDLVRGIIRHNSWATGRLIEHLHSLPPETLQLSAEGTYGSIGATLSHLVRAEGAYLARLTGETPHPGPATQRDLADVGAEAGRLAHRWEELLKAGIDPATSVTTMRGTQTAGAIQAQAINHAAEHRAHVCTVLGAHGLQVPALDPFAFGETVKEDRAR
jgi:uncharacterized damage-inducible protein DinB